jgi:hypothetical protein
MIKPSAASRRSLLLGAGASVAGAFIPYSGHATTPELATVAQNAIGSHGSQRFMAACMQQNMVDAIVVDHVNDTLNSRMLCLAPSGCSISDIVLAYPGWNMSGGKETNWPASYAVTAAIEYPEGQFTPVFRNRSRSLTVSPGPSLAEFDPCPISIPSGGKFFVKTCARWTRGAFPLSSFTAVNRKAGEWSADATGGADLTLVPGQASPQFSDVAGFGPSVYGRLGAPSVVLGVLGDSIARAWGDSGDPALNATFIRRAMRNAFPVLEMNLGGDNLDHYLQRNNGRQEMAQKHITHLLVQLCHNDLPFFPAEKVALSLQSALAPFLAAGVICYAGTALPASTSRDQWVTRNGQTTAAWNANRQRYNNWLRGRWQSIGLSGIFDFAGAVESQAESYWNVDDASTGYGAGGYPTLRNGEVAEVVIGLRAGNHYPPDGAALPCVAVNQPGDTTGAGAVVHATSNRSGAITGFVVERGGHNYMLPPLIAPLGTWTPDGVHPTKRAYDQMIAATGLGPTRFVLR